MVREREALPLTTVKDVLSERPGGCVKVRPGTDGRVTVSSGSHCSKTRRSSLSWLNASVPLPGSQRTVCACAATRRARKRKRDLNTEVTESAESEEELPVFAGGGRLGG